jgi:hypothetical protein
VAAFNGPSHRHKFTTKLTPRKNKKKEAAAVMAQ